MALFDMKQGFAPFMEFDKISFRCYTKEEIEKLSVVHVTQTQTFDDVGYPVRNGLYDPIFGPLEQYDRCETCGLRESFCPGHFGHITLCLPVFNPLLFSITFELMKGTCFYCHRFIGKSSGPEAKVLTAQLVCIDKGLLSAAEVIQAEVNKFFESHATVVNGKVKALTLTANDEEELLKQIKLLVARATELDGESNEKAKPVKNAVKLRDGLIKNFLKDYLIKRKTHCPHCRNRLGTVRNDQGRVILLDIGNVKSTTKSVTSKLHQQADAPDDNFDFEDTKKPEIKLQSTLNKGIAMETMTLMSKDFLEKQIQQVKSGMCNKLAWRAREVREHFRRLWQREHHIIRCVYPMFNAISTEYPEMVCPLDVMFMESVLIPPTKFRPIRVFGGEKFESAMTANFRQLLETDELLRMLHTAADVGSLSVNMKSIVENKTRGKSMGERIFNTYTQLQQRMNAIYDQAAIPNSNVPGLRQVLEKKEGLFRMNMMGKRVNFACRSVITPDPFLDVDEIGIPEVFAKKLTFAEPFNWFNEHEMRERIRTGPDKYPGANFVQQVGKPKERLMKENDRVSSARALHCGKNAVVHRHLNRGDLMLMNRQPTLHRPSIMGHRARILTGQRALRMNYAPCKAYNADFDGDEMNGHYVQSYVAQVEASELVAVGHNYLVPKDGTPILGLIQDHVVSGVLMTLRGRFFNKEDFMHLLLSAFGVPKGRLKLPIPAMIKPERLWSGKQVISAVLANCIPDNHPKINLKAKAKTPLSCWIVPGFKEPKFDMSESEVIFRQGELLVGVLDKSHYGATQFGLIHCCFELYGPKIAVQVLSCLSRLFPRYLQWHGFTLGVADILVTPEADRKRKQAIVELRATGPEITAKAFGMDGNPTVMQLRRRTAAAYNNPQKDITDVKLLDFAVKQTVAKYTDQINTACVPTGLIRSFPSNALQMMIQSGAKGSLVNSIQISCALGQIELEGQRPALSAVGRTLPSFKCFDPSPRAGGFVDQRFLTGINPQELFFHTMAGREGLIDTAVKTSRSGYLQRCIIKHLEGLVVAYDYTVRDHDGGVVQFRYGEDGMDVAKSTFLSAGKFDFLKENQEAIRQTVRPTYVRDSEWSLRETRSHYRKIRRQRKRMQTEDEHKSKGGFVEFSRIQSEKVDKDAVVELWRAMSEEEKTELNPRRLPDSVDVVFHPAKALGALPERLLDQIHSYIADHEEDENLRSTLFWKGMRGMCEPGENVGLLAAQSIGEPSTQMTLNTFHFAGRGEMNVTLGIPRLREILMTSGANISTPMVEIEVRAETTDEQLEELKREFSPILLRDVMRKFSVEERLLLQTNISSRQYAITIHLKKNSERESYARHLKRGTIISRIEQTVGAAIAEQLARNYRDTLELDHVQHHRLRQSNTAILKKEESNDDVEMTETVKGPRPTDDGASSDEEAERGNDADASESRLNQRHRDDAAEYEGEIEEEEIKEELGIHDRDDAGLENPGQDENEDSEADSEAEDEGPESKQTVVNALTERERIKNVIDSHNQICDYKFDTKHQRWCTIVCELPLKTKTKLNVAGIAQRVIESAVVWRTKNIDKCVIREEKRDCGVVRILQTQKINVEALYKHAELLNVNTLYSNDVSMMLKYYGVEACARVIVKEMNNVFGVYGIEVNPRHLTLVGDHMTNTGSILPFSRGAMSNNSSPLQKMTYETTLSFMRDAIMKADFDHLDSPSARLITGQTIRSGTGAFDLMPDANYIKHHSMTTLKFYE
ncbi:DNA-directed RNA polymerase subunit [Aphelenchoides besseyi]|nr:DNA-directed RNA polymerase subunit [Aphelenchoides besseyi]